MTTAATIERFPGCFPDHDLGKRLSTKVTEFNEEDRLLADGLRALFEPLPLAFFTSLAPSAQ